MTRVGQEIQRRRMQGSGWKLQGINYLKLFFHKVNALNGRTFVKFPTRTNSILNVQNFDPYFSLWSVLASINPVDDHPYNVTKNEPYRNEPNITNIDFTNVMELANIPGFEVLNLTLSTNVFE